MTDRERMSETVREASVLVEFSDVPLGMTLSQWSAQRAALARLERAKGRRLRRLAVKLGLCD